jgi:hypothetical protein
LGNNYGPLSIGAKIKMRKISWVLVLAALIIVLGMAASALGATQQPQQQARPFDRTTLPQQLIDLFKSGLPFKQFVSETIKNPESAQLIKLDLGNANILCGGLGPDVRTNKVVCNQAISFMNQTCTVDPSISRNCEHFYIKEYLHAGNLDETQQSKFSYMFLARSAAANNPGSSIEGLLELTRQFKE